LSTPFKQPIQCIQIYTGSLILILVYIFQCLMLICRIKMSYSSSSSSRYRSSSGHDSSYSSSRRTPLLSGGSSTSTSSSYSSSRYSTPSSSRYTTERRYESTPSIGKYSIGYSKENDKPRNWTMLVRSPVYSTDLPKTSSSNSSKAELMLFQGRDPSPIRYEEKPKKVEPPKDTNAAQSYFTDTHFSSNFLDGNLSLCDMLKKK